jgi:hypothetical protein
MINVRPWRRTTVDPGLPFNDLSDVLTFIVSPPSRSFSLLDARFDVPLRGGNGY